MGSAIALSSDGGFSSLPARVLEKKKKRPRPSPKKENTHEEKEREKEKLANKSTERKQTERAYKKNKEKTILTKVTSSQHQVTF